ncbi:MAG: Uma2 family endonuclease [Pyrinomonadaceae bacterium]|nr:Uma2 family endonuclease [Pyrinomonadaceae bacterium]
MIATVEERSKIGTSSRISRRKTGLKPLIERLPPDSTLILTDQTWENYEKLLNEIGEASGLRISFNKGNLEIMTLSTTHESYSRLIEKFIGSICITSRIDIASFGSATIKKSRVEKGSEPDACFYVQNAAAIGEKISVNFAIDPPPDVVVEIDWKHDSLYKFPIYAALNVPEIWRYDGNKMAFYKLDEEKYVEIEQSLALPMLSAQVLSDFLNRNGKESQSKILRDFEEWLKTKTK